MKKTTDDRRASAATLPGLALLTDEELLLEYRSSGSEDAFAELVHRYERELYSYLRRYLNDSVMAEDAFQATFLQVHLKCDQFEAGRKFRPWLYTIAINQAIDAQRRNRRHRLVSLDQSHRYDSEDPLGALIEIMENHQPGPVAQLETVERRKWVREAIQQLPEGLKNAVQLVYYQGLKYREAAEAMAIPVGTVKSRLHAAILKLNEAWRTSHPPA